ncbi:MAG: alpha/beta fold hydrolase [Nitrospinae bacterium]|nr:alpha/beta fold hydrolase [Nitrospinota bacterium]
MGIDLADIRDEYPFTPKRIDINGHQLSYLDEGPEEAPVILALHGNPTWSFYYRKLALALRGEFRVIAPDHMGCGLSDKPQDYDYTLKTHIGNLSALVAKLKLERFTLAVHDWGGAIGFGHAIRNPEMVKSIIIFNTAAFPSTDVPMRIKVCAWPYVGEFLVRKLNAFAGGAINLKMATNKPERLTHTVKQGYLGPYDSPENRIAIARFVQDIPMSPAHPTYRLVENIGDNLKIFENTPSLALWGMKDFCFHEGFLKEWLKRLKNVEAHMLTNAGHLALEDAHEEIIPFIKAFLERTQ